MNVRAQPTKYRAAASALLAGALLLAGCGKSADPAPAPTATASATPEPVVAGPERRIVALGDSLFAGYGLRPEQSYPARLEAALRQRGINARVTNAGVSGDTTQDGRDRLAFTLNSQAHTPDLVLVSLGGNDLLRGLDPEAAKANLDGILAELGKRHIKVVLMGMLAPPNMGADYAKKFDAIYPALARAHHAGLVPFFLQPVIDRPDLRLSDRMHPTAAGVEAIVSATLSPVVDALPKADPAGTGN